MPKDLVVVVNHALDLECLASVDGTPVSLREYVRSHSAAGTPETPANLIVTARAIRVGIPLSSYIQLDEEKITTSTPTWTGKL